MLIDQDNFLRAFGRDADYHDIHPQNAWLDRRTGYVLWILRKDEDALETLGISSDENRELRERVSAEPDRYLETLGLGHGEHHEILKKFLQSEWSDNMELRESVEGKYFKSIGAWKRAVPRCVVNAYNDFRGDEILNMAEEWLEYNGIYPIWK
ncbi:MAG: hypothetical protein OXN81_01970 [Alphaproteobacteria bacterium]|nr:hypothetical protein [Alphaproteobacteria bacterium]